MYLKSGDTTNMKLKLILIIVLTLLSSQIFAAKNTENLSMLLGASESAHELKLELLKARYLQRDNIKQFLERYLGRDTLKNSHEFLYRVSGSGNILSFLDKSLEARFPNKKDRKRIINSFCPVKNYMPYLKTFIGELNSMVEPLRMPVGSGYKYARYAKEPDGNIATQQLTAVHAIGNFQRYDRTISDRIYRIHIYSPKKSGLFHKNRDSYLQTLVVNYNSQGKSHTITKQFNRFLKRGESLDFELPEVSDETSVTLTFACKPEHRKKAFFYIEFVRAKIVDDANSPYFELINRIINSPLKHKSINGLNTKVTVILNALKNAISNDLRYVGASDVDDVKTTIHKKENSPFDSEKLNYFMYMLKDKDISRDMLIQKFQKIVDSTKF